MNPSAVVFDLDYTIWPFDCDKDIIAPFTYDKNGNVLDRDGRLSNPYPDVPGIIAHIADAKVPIIIASKNSNIFSIEELLSKIKINCRNKKIKTIMDAISYIHAYSSDVNTKGKDTHFANIYKSSGINLKRMIFYDDNHENISCAKEQGITSIHITRSTGLTWRKFNQGIHQWRSRNLPELTLDNLALACNFEEKMIIFDE
jgi:magnesium-dependent phosphatase 1